MKWNKQEAKFRFRKQILEFQSRTRVEYETSHVLEDEKVQQWLKVSLNWPTVPGLEESLLNDWILKELKENSELLPVLQE